MFANVVQRHPPVGSLESDTALLRSFAARFRRKNAPVGIRTRAPGSTGRDHRPLDHRGSSRRKVWSPIYPFLSDGGDRRRGSPFPFYLPEVMWLPLATIWRVPGIPFPLDTMDREVAE